MDREDLAGAAQQWGFLEFHKETKNPAIGTASDADFFRIDVAGSFEKFCREHFILKIAATKIFEVGFLKIDAVAGGAADIGFNADIPAGNEGSNARAPIGGRLSGGAAVRQNQRGMGLIAFEVEGDPEERADGFAVEGFVADDVRRSTRRGTQTGDGGKRKLRRIAGSQVVHPQIARLNRAFMGEKQAIAGRRKRVWISGRTVGTRGDGKEFWFCGGEVP